jgi:F0F1-type ATP synthase membrane subunit b/b'
MRADGADAMLAGHARRCGTLHDDVEAEVAEVRVAAERLRADAQGASERMRAATEAYLAARRAEADRLIRAAEAEVEAKREEGVRVRIAADAYVEVRRAKAEEQADALLETAKAEAARIIAEAQAAAGAMIAAAVIEGTSTEPTPPVSSAEAPDQADAATADHDDEQSRVQVVVMPAAQAAESPKTQGRFGV